MNITWTTEKRKVSDLAKAEYNPRKLTEKEREDLERSIDEYGVVVPVVVNVGDREDVLIGGHQRIRIYQDRGFDEVEVRVPSRELTEPEEKNLNLRLNKNTGSWDYEKLAEMEMEILLEVGFGDEELAYMWDDVNIIDEDPNPEEKAKAIDEVKVEPGEVYQLGDHRLMIGDATNPGEVQELMSGELAETIYCDPPLRRNTDNYEDIISASLECALENTREEAHILYWSDQEDIHVVQRIYEVFGIENQSVAIWIKREIAKNPKSAFARSYIPCVYGTRGNPYLNKKFGNMTEIVNRETETGIQQHDEIFHMVDIWVENKGEEEAYHPKQKPASLHQKPLKRITAPGHVVMDLFGGSGSTLMACEQLGRKARVMEIDPVYATIIIDRWQDYTGAKAKKI